MKKILHFFGIHSWKYHMDYYMRDYRYCKVCNKSQSRKRNDIFAEWEDLPNKHWEY